MKDAVTGAKTYLQSPWRTFFFAIKPAWASFYGIWFLSMLGNIFGFLLPYVFKIIADRVQQEAGILSRDDFILFSVLILAALIGREISFRAGHFLELRAVTVALRHISAELFQNILRRPSSYFENRFSGDLGRRVEQISTSVTYFIEQYPWQATWFVSAFLMSIFLLGTTHPSVFIVFAIWLGVFIVSSIPMLWWHHHASKAVAASHARLSGNIIDVFGNVSVVHAFGQLLYEQDYNEEVLREVIKAERKQRLIEIFNKAQQGFSIVLLGISLSVVSLLLFTKGEFSAGDFVIVATLIPSLTAVVWNFGDTVIRSARFFGQMVDAVEYLQHEQQQLEEGKVAEIPRSSTVAFDNVSFHYPGTEKAVFEKFSLEIKEGERVGIVGASGAGKSTLVKLLLRQYEPQRGIIAIGSVATTHLTLDTFNRLIAYVPQDTSLFHRSLFENIRYARPDATREEIIAASKRARAHEFVDVLPEKYETTVGERGIKLSGGQRQRIALARAILKDAPILVLDEATSSLDTESETLIQQGFLELFKGRTVIAVAHRLSTLRTMDRIVVIEGGTIIESGSPKELLSREDGMFKRMWEHQKSGFI